MRAIRNRFAGLGLVVMLCCGTGLARGEVFVQTVTYPAEVTVADTTGGIYLEKYTALFDQFNPAVGTLHAIQFDLAFGYQLVLTGDPVMGGSGGGSLTGLVYVNDRLEPYIGGGNGGGGGVGPGMELVIPIPQNYTQTSVPGGIAVADSFSSEFLGTGETLLTFEATAQPMPTTGTMRVELPESPPATITLTYDFTPAPLFDGDYNGDGVVDAGDYVVWRNHLGQDFLLPGDRTPGSVTAEDYEVWRENYGLGGNGLEVLPSQSVPEPSSLLVVSMGLLLAHGAMRFRKSRGGYEGDLLVQKEGCAISSN